MSEENRNGVPGQEDMIDQLRKLAEWKNNDAVKLAFFGQKNLRQIKGLDLTGITELKRHGNGAIELKFVDKVRVLDLLSELLDRRDDRELGKLLDELGTAESGDGQ